MIGVVPIAVEPPGGLPAEYDLSVPSPLPSLLNDPDAELIFLLEAQPLRLVAGVRSDFPYSIGEEAIAALRAGELADTVVVRLGSEAFRTEASDVPPNASYPPRLSTPYSFSTSIPEPGADTGLGRTAFGVVTIENQERELDNYIDAYWEGRVVEILVGGTFDVGRVTERKLRIGEFWRLQRTATGITSRPGEIDIIIGDPFARLDIQLQEILYAGTGGLEGGANIESLPKPLAFGRLRNVPAVLVDEVSLVYQLHDGAIEAISEVRDKGVALTSAGDISGLGLGSVYDWVVVAGQYVTDLSLGIFRLGATAQGLVAVDCDGDNTGGWAASTAEVVRRIATRYGYLADPDEIDAVSFAAFPRTGPVGYYTWGRELTISQAIDELVTAADGWVTFTRNGRLRIGPYVKPEDAVPVATLSAMLMAGIDSDPALEPAWIVRVGYQRMWAVQSEDELAGSVTAANKATFSKEYRYAVSEHRDTSTIHRRARELEINSFFDEKASADDLAVDVLQRQRVRRRLYKAEAQRSLLRRSPGEVVRAFGEDAALQAGRQLLVLEVAEDAPDRVVDLVLWG